MKGTEWGLKSMEQLDQLTSPDRLEEIRKLIFSFLASKAKSSKKVYEGHLKEFLSFMDEVQLESFKHVEYSHLMAYRETLIRKDLKDNTINVKLATVRSFFKFLNQPIDNEGKTYLNNNVASHLKKLKVDPYSHSQTFDRSLFQRILKDLDEDDPIQLRDKIIFMLLAYCGLRKSEVRQMKVASIYLEEGICYYTVKGKGNKVIDKELPPEISRLIGLLVDKIYLKENDYLFQSMGNRKGQAKNLSESAINYILNHYVKEYGFTKRFRVHSLRAMSGQEVYQKTKDILLTQKHLNHSNISTTQIYLDRLGESRKVRYYGKMFDE